MTSKFRSVAALAATAAVAAPVAATAATKPAKTAEPIGHVDRTSKSTAKLKVSYSCKSGTTLWISLKQTKSGHKSKRLKREGSSRSASAWWQSHRNRIKCNGEEHTKRFKLDKVEPGSKGRLKEGWAWLQFCVTKGNKLTVSVAEWVRVETE
jgi:hypothetical protein